MAVFNNRTEANAVLTGLGNFFQPEKVSPGTSLADWISKDNDLNNEDDWRFFGKRFRPADPSDRVILENPQTLALEAARVFKTIKNTKLFKRSALPHSNQGKNAC